MSDFYGHEIQYRGEEIVAKRSSVPIKICGLGALGSHLSDLLVRQGYSLLTLIDKDTVERKNIGTQIYDPSDIGRSKAIQLANKITRRYGIKSHVAENVTITDMTVDRRLKGSKLVIDVFDNTGSRKLIQDSCKRLGIENIHAGLGSLGFFEVKWNESYYCVSAAKGEDGPCEYSLATNLIILCVGILAETINRWVDKGEKINSEFWLESLKLNTEKI